MSFVSRFATAALVSALCLSPAAAMAEVAVAPFYEAVMKMKPEGRLGQVISRERIATPVKGARAWRIAYISSDLNDRKTISTALVIAPKGKAPAGGRPLVTWAHGTTGTAANCAPSQMLNPAQPLNEYFLVGGNSWTDYGVPSIEEFIAAGYVVAATDYQGLGSAGKHQYAVSVTNGRDAINAARAAASMKDTGAGKKVVTIGWSQGGGATIAAAGQPGYIAQKGTARDGLDFVGFVAMAPVDAAAAAPDSFDAATADKFITELGKSFSANVFDFAHFSMNLWGIQAAFPGKLKMTDIFTEEGARALDEIYSNKCMHAGSDTINFTYGNTYSALVRPDLRNTLAWAQSLKTISVDHTVKPTAPVIIYYGSHDTTLPPVMGEIYRKRLCGIHANVARVQLPGDQNHFTTPGVSAPLYLPWIRDRFAGKAAEDGCAAN